MKHKKYVKHIRMENNSQMIILMGIVMAISVFVMSNLAANITNIDLAVSNEPSSSLLDEFKYLKETFPYSLNYDLADRITIDSDNNVWFYGDINNITNDNRFERTNKTYKELELRHNNLFDAVLDPTKPWYVHDPSSSNPVYYVNVKLSLSDGKNSIEEDVTYSISLRPNTSP
jgi:hypothetical protein